MLQIIPSPHENVVVIKATGLLTDYDYNKFIPKLEEIIKLRGSVSVLVEFEGFRGWKPKAMWDDFKLGFKHDGDFKKIAVVGEKARHHVFTDIVKAFSSGKVHYFDHDKIQKAWDWILQEETAGNEENSLEEQGRIEMKPYSRIITAMDFSPHANRALSRAVEVGVHYNAVIFALHVFESMIQYYNVYQDDFVDDFVDSSLAYSLYDPELDQKMSDSARERLEKIIASIDYPDITARQVWGSPVSTIISFAESQRADLIVVGSHGRRGFAKLLGSTANGVVNSARCDVLVVRLD